MMLAHIRRYGRMAPREARNLFRPNLFLEVVPQIIAPQLIFGFDRLVKWPPVGVGTFSGYHYGKPGMQIPGMTVLEGMQFDFHAIG